MAGAVRSCIHILNCDHKPMYVHLLICLFCACVETHTHAHKIETSAAPNIYTRQPLNAFNLFFIYAVFLLPIKKRTIHKIKNPHINKTKWIFTCVLGGFLWNKRCELFVCFFFSFYFGNFRLFSCFVMQRAPVSPSFSPVLVYMCFFSILV